MNLDGSNIVRLTTNDVHDIYPAISPDGQSIAFARSEGPAVRIYVMNADGRGATPLTSGVDDQGVPSADMAPAWSPDGGHIVFAGFRSGCEQLFVMKADGSDVTGLTPCSGADRDPSWSPDGRYIAFQRISDSRRRDIWIVENDGTGATNVTNDEDLADDGAPAWSPDSRRIVWASTRGGGATFQIWVMNRDGSAARQLTNEPTGAFGPALSPDGTRLAYTAFNGDRDNIWVATADGTGAHALTATDAKDQAPQWGPSP